MRFDSPAKHLEQRFMVLLDLRGHMRKQISNGLNFKVSQDENCLEVKEQVKQSKVSLGSAQRFLPF